MQDKSVTSSDAEGERAAFEVWAKANILPLTIWTDQHGPYYAHDQTYAAWGAWQARAAIARALPTTDAQKGR